MKKTILFAVGIFFAVSVSAQTQRVSRTDVNLQKKEATLMSAEMKQGPRKDLASGVYYTRPEGSLYWGFNEQAQYYDTSRLYIPPFTTITFKNMCQNPALATWTMNGNDVSDLADENNDLVFALGADNAYYMPTINVGTDSYMIGEKTGHPEWTAISTDTMDYHSFVDQVTGKIYAFGSMDTGYLFGTGNYAPKSGDYAGRTFKSFGFAMECPKPIAPLYIEYFNFLIMADSNDPIKDGKEVTMQIRNVEQLETETGVHNTPGAKIIAELKATKADLSASLNDGDVTYTQTGHYWLYNLKFSNKETDSHGNLVTSPVVVDEPFYIVITGHEQDGVNFGYRIVSQPEEDQMVYGTWALAYENGDENSDNYSAWYGNESVVDMSFYGGYDYCEVMESAELTDESGNPTGETVSQINVIRVSADGETATNEGFENLNGQVILNSAFPWFDGKTGEENYICPEIPDWVYLDGVSQYGTYDSGSQYFTGETYITITCEPLEAGETGRAASIYLEGKGHKSAYPIIVLQGDATLDDAIENVTVVNTNNNNATYNLAGQRVNANYKGVVIKNGKKAIVK
ncbi:MAG: hypothetical protein IJV23_00870 [Prevotella sp.]|nr:hypothetical protein [Prevotella sp.]